METLFHLIMPAAIALAAGFGRKKVLRLAVLTVLPDVDHLIAYRALFHNFFFLAFAILLVFYATRKDRESAFLALLFLGSHLLFDVGGGIAVLYPLDDGYYSFRVSVVGLTPAVDVQFSRTDSSEWKAELLSRLTKWGRTWASSEMLATLLLIWVACSYRRQHS